MPLRLPPLNAVRAFEAAGRLQSFSKAAAELHVTPGAVSRQIGKLEVFLGLRLFLRTGADVRLTAEGEAYLVAVRDGLGRLAAGTREVQAGAGKLHIWGSRFFIRIWLLPRLPGFHAQHPEQEVMITTALPDDPVPQDVDVAIRAGESLPGMLSHRLIERVVVPVCSPAYLQAAPPLRRAQDLEHHTLLQAPTDAADWQRWYARTGAPPVPLARRIPFTSADIAYSAALDGLGLALGRHGFIEADVRAGRLVLPFDVALPTEGAFLLMYRDRDVLPRRIAVFRDWMLAQLRGE
ncbi:LysR substrate-binding domain-containing protein [Humitalea sp. 24SJ18S-53]|uniref:LysR substrate-binding domain-containing protein n=1 Tax=Humitalea sp. 24SJ18S-53 TaxID=3422307 RepID=UPI003D677756